MDIQVEKRVPDLQVCEQARRSRDSRFDGLFYTAVTSTRIYCRSVCPVPTVKQENVRYYPSAAAAEAAGFRPCLICRPELAPSAWWRGDALIERALRLIDEGLLAEQPLAALAARVGTSERHLRRLFVERLGASPKSVHGTRRLLFAKQLLTETALPITEVALESGFGSLRRFNDTFRRAYRLAPSDLRRHARHAAHEALTLRLGYRPPYDFRLLLHMLRSRALPGVEIVTEHGYSRVLGPADAPGWLRLSAWPGEENALRLQLHCLKSASILQVVTRLRRMFDLDAEPETIRAALSADPRLRASVERHPGLRLPGAWDGFEVAVQVVLGRQGGVPAQRLAARIARAFGDALETPFAPGLERLFPAPASLADADRCALASLGLRRECAAAVRGVARALLDGQVDFSPERTLDEFVAAWSAVPGLDALAAHDIALRALGHPDAFPGNAALLARADRWRPWRAYAALHVALDTAPPESVLRSTPADRNDPTDDTRRAQ